MEFVNENLLSQEQRTEEWYKNRAGKFTGSRFVDLFARDLKGNPLKAYTDLINQVVVERLTNDYIDNGMDSYALKWGREVEPFGRDAYCFYTGEKVIEASFINHPIYEFVGASPDGRIGKNGGLELKCPKDPKIHIERFNSGMNEKEFMPQVQGCIWCCDAEYWDWVSFDPRMPDYMRLYIQRVWRNDAYIKKLESAVLRAEGEVREQLINFKPENVRKILDKSFNTER